LAQPIEQCFAHPVWRGPQAGSIDHFDFAALPLATNDADFVRR